MTYHDYIRMYNRIEESLETPKIHNRKRFDERTRKILEVLKSTPSAELKVGSDIVRLITVNLGTRKYQDFHLQVECVEVAKICDKIIIGKCGERVQKDRIIVVLQDER